VGCSGGCGQRSIKVMQEMTAMKHKLPSIRSFVILPVALAVLGLSACGGGGDAAQPQPQPPAAPPPVLMTTTNLGSTPALPADVVDGVILTKLDAMLAAGATVGQVNAALASVNGSIVHSRVGSPFVTVGIPAQANAQALLAAAQVLAAQPGIAAAFPGRASADKVLPPGEAGTGPDTPHQLGHLLPTRFPAAWNAKRLLANCAANRVPVLIPDQYSLSEPIGFGTEVPGTSIQGGQRSGTNPHGHRVTGTLAANFDSVNPTGAVPFPQCLDITGVELFGLTELERVNRTADLFPLTGPFIVNYSQGLQDLCSDDANGVEACTPEQFGNLIATPFERALLTAVWQSRARPRGGDALVVAAAGNERAAQSASIYPGLGMASYTSPLALAQLSGAELLAGIQDSALWGGNGSFPSLVATGAPLTQITTLINAGFAALTGFADYAAAPNVLIVGSTTKNQTLSALTEARTSDSNPNVRAVGESVFVFGEGFVSGTSQAAPQVAGLAAYLWLLSPELRGLPAQQTAALIGANTVNNGNTSNIIDAYAAVLSLDRAEPISVATAPIRGALLDVDDNGGFDTLDLIAFASAYGLNGGTPPSGTRDYSRYDLNGDGYTGSIGTARFDLDRVGSTQFGTSSYGEAVQTIEDIEVRLNENALSDLQILCYYAYSPLYQGDTTERDNLLGVSNCVNANLGATLGAFIGNTTTLSVTLADDTGAPLAGVALELTPTGGSVSPSSGTTNASGELEANATVDAGGSTIRIDVTARDTSGETLAQTTVEGSIPVGAPTLEVDFVSQMPGNARVPLTVRAVSANALPVAGLFVELAATGGVLGTTSGATDAQGQMRTTAQLDPGSNAMTINITLRSAFGGEIYDTTSVNGIRGAIGILGLAARRERATSNSAIPNQVGDGYLNTCGFGQNPAACLLGTYGTNSYTAVAGGSASFTHDLQGSAPTGLVVGTGTITWNAGASYSVAEVQANFAVGTAPVPVRVRLECAAGSGEAHVSRISSTGSNLEWLGFVGGAPDPGFPPYNNPYAPYTWGGGVITVDFVGVVSARYNIRALGAASTCPAGATNCGVPSGSCSYEITTGDAIEYGP
jgi:hypothetical protein